MSDTKHAASYRNPWDELWQEIADGIKRLEAYDPEPCHFPGDCRKADCRPCSALEQEEKWAEGK